MFDVDTIYGYVHSEDTLKEVLEKMGFDYYELVCYMTAGSEYAEELQHAKEMADYYERIADGEYQNLRGLADEVEAWAEFLESGKRKYTKADVAHELRRAINNYL